MGTSIKAKATAWKAEIPRHDNNAIVRLLANRSSRAGVHAWRLGTVVTQQGIEAKAGIGEATVLDRCNAAERYRPSRDIFPVFARDYTGLASGAARLVKVKTQLHFVTSRLLYLHKATMGCSAVT